MERRRRREQFFVQFSYQSALPGRFRLSFFRRAAGAVSTLTGTTFETFFLGAFYFLFGKLGPNFRKVSGREGA
jgi:hypothetical protein